MIGEYAGPPAGLLALLRTLNARLDTARLAPARRTIRIGDLRLTLASDGTFSLNDTATDPAQEHDLAAARPEDVKRLRKLLETPGRAASRAEPPTPVDDETQRQLKSLGYVH